MSVVLVAPRPMRIVAGSATVRIVGDRIVHRPPSIIVSPGSARIS